MSILQNQTKGIILKYDDGTQFVLTILRVNSNSCKSLLISNNERSLLNTHLLSLYFYIISNFLY